MLFGDRIGSADLNPLSSVSIATDASALKSVSDLATRGGIVITR